MDNTNTASAAHDTRLTKTQVDLLAKLARGPRTVILACGYLARGSRRVATAGRREMKAARGLIAMGRVVVIHEDCVLEPVGNGKNCTYTSVTVALLA